MLKKTVDFSIVMPCLNEKKTVGKCIKKVMESFDKTKNEYEIIIADNGSTDGSVEIAKKLRVKVVNVVEKGYGAALNKGIGESLGKYIIMGDSDDSYDFSKLDSFIQKLKEGNQLVMGNRFRGEIKTGAMPILHKLIGNPLFSFMGRLFFNSKVGDFYCGLRGFTKEAWKKMNLQSTGMEYAIEMVIKASLLKLMTTEVPITLYKDGRGRPPHLKTWQDGWRTLRFILLYSPSWLFYLPGFSLMAIGLVLFILAAVKPFTVFGIVLDVHTLLVASALLLIGFQIVLFGVFTKLLIKRFRLLPITEDSWLLKKINSAHMFLASVIFFIVGLVILANAGLFWYSRGFGELDYSATMRTVIPSVFLMQLGVQFFFNAFFLDLLMIPKGRN